jgi:hypothetical protein
MHSLWRNGRVLRSGYKRMIYLSQGGNDRYFFGLHLLLVVSSSGVITGRTLAAGNIQDRWLTERLLSTRAGQPSWLGQTRPTVAASAWSHPRTGWDPLRAAARRATARWSPIWATGATIGFSTGPPITGQRVDKRRPPSHRLRRIGRSRRRSQLQVVDAQPDEDREQVQRQAAAKLVLERGQLPPRSSKPCAQAARPGQHAADLSVGRIAHGIVHAQPKGRHRKLAQDEAALVADRVIGRFARLGPVRDEVRRNLPARHAEARKSGQVRVVGDPHGKAAFFLSQPDHLAGDFAQFQARSFG